MQLRVWAIVGMLLTTSLVATVSQAADSPAEATVTDAEKNELKVSGLKFTTGVRRLTWLADPNGTTEEAKKGPLALEVREPHSTTYTKGIVTFVPLNSVESIKYDYDKRLASIAIKGLKEPLPATLQFKGLNVLNFSGTVVGETLTFSGGTFTKGSIKSVAFAGAKALPERKAGMPWQIQIDQRDAKDPTLTASNFKFLYLFQGGVEVLADGATLRKGEPLKLDDSVKTFIPVAVDLNMNTAAVEVQIGDMEKVVVIPSNIEKDGKPGLLIGLLSEVEAGWKMFPIHTIKTMKRQKKD
ncbi:MAG: hypothetical protein L0241_07215 [Planctomycetia bacterium]|nr:hypothetical protein [Planctomycetia bacterium]